MSEEYTPFKMKGSPAKLGTIQGTAGHASALKHMQTWTAQEMKGPNQTWADKDAHNKAHKREAAQIKKGAGKTDVLTKNIKDTSDLKKSPAKRVGPDVYIDGENIGSIDPKAKNYNPDAVTAGMKQEHENVKAADEIFTSPSGMTDAEEKTRTDKEKSKMKEVTYDKADAEERLKQERINPIRKDKDKENLKQKIKHYKDTGEVKGEESSYIQAQKKSKA